MIIWYQIGEMTLSCLQTLRHAAFCWSPCGMSHCVAQCFRGQPSIILGFRRISLNWRRKVESFLSAQCCYVISTSQEQHVMYIRMLHNCFLLDWTEVHNVCSRNPLASCRQSVWMLGCSSGLSCHLPQSHGYWLDVLVQKWSATTIVCQLFVWEPN